jgi:ribose transport system ATP-binding protein
MTGQTTRGYPGQAPAIEIRRLSKRFGSSLVLNDVALEVMPGEVHGLLGQNGSGKSTLIKILAGFHEPEPGAELLMHGEGVDLPIPPAAARGLGLVFVHQHLGLVPSLTVLENLLIGDIATTTRWRIDWRREAARARQTFGRFNLDIDPTARIGDLPQVTRALIAIVRAFEEIRTQSRRGNGVLVLDEPTPFLPKVGVDQLFALVRNIVKEGAAVIFVSHDIDEIREITDRATVLRDGVVAGTVVSREASADQFVELIIGRRVSRYKTQTRDLAHVPVTVSARNVSGEIVRDVAVDVRRGEILGLTGLIGSGFDELPYLLYGASRATGGQLDAGGRRFDLRQMSPPTAMRANLALLPSDRLGAAGAGNLSITENLLLPVFAEFRRWFGLDWAAMDGRAAELGRNYDVRPNRPEVMLASLSGGNAQKVLMAKWLQTSPLLLMLDEPTQGVDVGARQQLFSAIDHAAASGTAVIVASTDYEQLAQICDRVLVFARGRVVTVLEGAAISKDKIAEHCLRSVGATGFIGETETLPA